ncbi:MAG: ABC transporter permease [Endomicrobiales bacterium]
MNSESPGSIVIRPPRGLDFNFKELWEYRELAYFFAWREIKVRYKQTFIGVFWAVLQPLLATVIFTFIFGAYARIPSDGIPYPLFVYTGLVFWNYFAFGLSHASESMISNAGIIQKIYFPRLLIPLSAALVGLIDFAVSSLLIVIFLLFYGRAPHPAIAGMLPLLLLVTFLSSAGIGSFLGALNVKYRDVRYALPFFIQMLLFLTPVIYPVSIAGDTCKWALALNPMSGVIDVARHLVTGTGSPDYALFAVSAAMSVLLFVAGIIYFKKTERFFADII